MKSGCHEGRRQQRSQVATQGVSIKSQVAKRVIARKEVGLPLGVSPTKKSGYHEGRCQRRGPVAMKGIANEEVGLP